jgi:hypothetical protein
MRAASRVVARDPVLVEVDVLAAGGGIEDGARQVNPPSVERLVNTVGTTSELVIGIEEISQTLCLASNATLGSLTRSNGAPVVPPMSEVAVRPGRTPLVYVWPPSLDVAKPMSVEPPSKNRPTWNADTTVEPFENVSGSSSVACWLVVLVKGSLLTRVSGTLAAAGDASTRNAVAESAARRRAGLGVRTVDIKRKHS